MRLLRGEDLEVRVAGNNRGSTVIGAVRSTLASRAISFWLRGRRALKSRVIQDRPRDRRPSSGLQAQ